MPAPFICVRTGRVLSLERKSDRSGNAVVRLYQNWRQGVSATPVPLRPLHAGEGTQSLGRHTRTWARRGRRPTHAPQPFWVKGRASPPADDLDRLDEFAAADRGSGNDQPPVEGHCHGP